MKQFFLIAALILILGTVFIISVVSGDKKAKKDNTERLSFVKNIQFSGKVISYKTFQFGGRNSYMVCLKLDHSNARSYYVLNKLCFLKIKNGIATMAVGFLDPYYGIPSYVDVNSNYNGVEKYSYPGGKTQTFELSLANYDLTEKDINNCD